MLIVALDTTTRAGSLALARDAAVFAVATGDAARPHAERLPGALKALLEANALALVDVDGFVVAAGPGSFTGLRIGIAAIQGLAFALNKPVVAISVLDALAAIALNVAVGEGQPAERAEDTRKPLPGSVFAGAFMDAQRREVFAALYRTDAGGATTLLDGPVSEPPAQVLDRWASIAGGASLRLAGDATATYRDLVLERLGNRALLVDPLPPLAPTLATLGARELAAGRGVAPHAVRPLYVRRPDAELARERNPR